MMTTKKGQSTTYKTVRGLERGLALLEMLNHLGGSSSCSELSNLTGLHRTTVKRLLETFCLTGHIRKVLDEDKYQLTVRTQELSKGLQDHHWISSVAAPLLRELLHEIPWPSNLTTLENDHMVIRETTHLMSRLSFHRYMVGHQLPMLVTANGRAYLAFCSEAERHQLINRLRSRNDNYKELANEENLISKIIEETRRQGYGHNYRNWETQNRFASIAVPIIIGEKIYGCISVVYLAKAMLVTDAAERYLPLLNETARQIAKEVATSQKKG